MTYTKKQRVAIAAAFKAAKDLLWSGRGRIPTGKEQWICHALAEVERSKPDAGMARVIVRDRLDGSTWLSGWLMLHGVAPRKLTNRRLQAHRHAWLDLLIKEFEA